MSHELIPILDLELVDFASYDATQREQVLQALQTMLGSAAGFIAPHSDFWKKWTRLPTLGGYQLLLDALSPHVALALALGLIDAADQRNRTLPEQPIRLRLVLAYGTVHPVGDSWSGQVLHELHELRACPELIAAEQRLWTEQCRTGALLATIPLYIQWRQSDQTQPELESINWTDLTVRSAAATPLKAKHLHRQPTLAPQPSTAPAPVPPAPDPSPNPVQNQRPPQTDPQPTPPADQPTSPPKAETQRETQISNRQKLGDALGSGFLTYATLLGGAPNAALLSLKNMFVLSALLVSTGLLCTQTPLRKRLPAKLTSHLGPFLLGVFIATWSFRLISPLFKSPQPATPAPVETAQPKPTRPELYTLRLTVLDPDHQPTQADIDAPFGEEKRLSSGWEVSIAASQAPETPFTIYASTPAGLRGSVTVELAEQAIMPLHIQLQTKTTTVTGTVQAPDGTPLVDREVWIDAPESQATRTDRFGQFQLKTTQPPTHFIQICVAQPGQAPYRQSHRVQDHAAIVLPP